MAETIELRGYQRAAVDALYECWSESRGDHLLVVAPTGSGKSVILGALCAEAIEWPGTRVCVVTHRKELVEQDARAIMRLTDERVGIYNAALGAKELYYPVTVATIQSIYTKAPKADPWDIIIVDEAHLVPPESTTRYRRFLDEARLQNPRCKIVGLTATPYRMGSGRLDEGKDALFDVIAYEITIPELLEAGHLCEIISRGGVKQIDTAGVRVRGGEYVASELGRAADDPDVTRAAVEEIVRFGADRRGWLLFAASVAHAGHVLDEVRSHGVAAEIVTGDTPQRERAAILRAYKAGQLRCLVSCEVLTTGFDAPHTDLLGMLRPTKSPVLYVQMCLDAETEILTDLGWRGRGEIQEGDRVAALDLESGAGVWSTVVGTVDRDLLPGEAFVSIESSRLSIRVTDQHDMVFAARKYGGGHSSWRKTTAAELAHKRDGYRIPGAVSIDEPGVPLTDDELRFLGLFMTDGTFNPANNAITIYQSERYLEVIQYIERTLQGCGFKYGHRVTGGDVAFGKVREHDIHRFTISKGVPRGRDREKRGWGELEEYVSKDFPECLLACSRRQLDVLLEAIHYGDGQKNQPEGWTRRSYSISTGNRAFAERLQALCVTRGLAANVATVNGGELFYVHVTPHEFRTVGGAGQRDRASLAVEKGGRAERVWCVTTEHGTIVTRRRGKVAVMGNCGRGMRPASGKENCLLLDFAGVVAEHGPVDQVNVRSRGESSGDSEPGEAPVKLCPECRLYLATATRTCPSCGHEFPPPEPESKLRETAYAGAVLSHQVEELGVESMTLERWQPRDPSKPDTLVITYRTGMRDVREWLCPEHKGYARGKFESRCIKEWGITPPSDIGETLERVDEIPVPAAILVRPQKGNAKYLEVVRRVYQEVVSGVPAESELDLPF